MRIRTIFVGAAFGFMVSGCEQPASVPLSNDSLPPPPAWSASMIGKPIRERFTVGETCNGYIDVARVRYEGAKPGVGFEGWGWDGVAKKRGDHILLTDEAGRIVGAGEGGRPRPDVPQNMPAVTAPDTGWSAASPLLKGKIQAWVLQDGDKIACQLATFEF